MRVAYVCADPGVPVFGRKGCSIHVQEVLRVLRGMGVRVDLFAARFDGDPPPGLDAVVVHRLPTVPKGDMAGRERAAVAANRDLHAALEHVGPFDLVYERYSLWSYAGMEWARTVGTPGLLEVNAPLIEEQAEHRGLADRAAAEAIADRVFGAARALIAVSGGVAEYLGRFASPSGRVHVIPNAVNPDRFPADCMPTLPAPAGVLTIGFVGTMKPWHGLPDLVEAFDRLRRRAPASRLLIVGDGTERGAFEADLAARGLLGAAHLTGAVDPDDVPGLLASMDVAVAPYPRREDFYFSPLKVYEAMAAARPVVASRIGQLADLIRDGENGLLCPPGDPAALAEAVLGLRDEPARRRRMGQAARAEVLGKYTWGHVAHRLLDLAGLGTVPRLQLAEGRN